MFSPPSRLIQTNCFSALFPWPVGAAAIQLGDPVTSLFPEEQATILKATMKRRNEFIAGRHCARLAMLRIGHPAVVLPSGLDRMPIWPAALVGSITHGAECCAAVVAIKHQVCAIGIDMEALDAVSEELASIILRLDETAQYEQRLRPDGADWLTLIFCLKEAAYKVFYAMFRQIIDFHEMRIVVRHESRTFTATPHLKNSVGAPTFHGKYLVQHGRIHAACWA